jgi:hypothetical protein
MNHKDTKTQSFFFVPLCLRGEQKMNHEDTRTQSFLLFVVRKNEPPGHQDTKFFPSCLCAFVVNKKMNHEDTRTQSFLPFVVNKEVTDGFSSQCR